MGLPGNRVSRALAGLPRQPKTASLSQDALDFALRAPSSPLGFECVQPPGVTRDLALHSEVGGAHSEVPFEPLVAHQPLDLLKHLDAVSEIFFEFSFDTMEVPPEGFVPVSIAGSLFLPKRKLGTQQDPHHRDGYLQEKQKPPTKSELLLAKLLPILLPPARAEFADVFVLPHSLYAFQRDGIKWLVETAPGALLADDMGLGKTVQAIVAMRHKFRLGAVTRALVVAPKSVIPSWQRHLADWAPELQVIAVSGSQPERGVQWRAIRGDQAHVGVVTYQSLQRDADIVQELPFDLIVADEVQNAKNPSAKQTQTLRGLKSQMRWGLSGTPLENALADLVSILRFLDPRVLRKSDPSIEDVHATAARMMLRRKKSQVLRDLPGLVSDVEYVELLPEQRRSYQEMENQGVAALRGRDTSVTNVLALITRLKQICNGIEGKSAKAEWLNEYLDIAREEGDKTIVFSQYVETLDDLAATLSEFDPLSFTGQQSNRRRETVLGDFETRVNHSLLLMSLRAGGIGLTITAANRVVHFDSWWNPAVMSQATARVHRIGQRKTVFEKTLVAVDTVEERIQKVLDDKRGLFSAVVDDLSTQGLARVLGEEDLYGLFGLAPPNRRSDRPRASAVHAEERSRPVESAVISADTPLDNVLWVRRILRDLRGVVWWVDPNFSRRPLEDLAAELDVRRVAEVRIMSRDLSPKDQRDFERFREQLARTAVRAEWRVCEERLYHDRFLADNERCYNMPPVNLIYDQTAPYSEIRLAVTRPPLEEWWSRGRSI
jgi:superfamily II DNA or RNA helicase